MDYLTTKKFNIAEINKRKAPTKVLYRIDIHCEIQAVPFAALSEMQPGEPSEKIRERVIRARQIQTVRFSSLSLGEGGGKGRIHCNAQMTEKMLHEFAESDAASMDMLRMAMERLKLSARAYSGPTDFVRGSVQCETICRVNPQQIL